VRDSKRPKERSQDREYRQRYSLTPGKQIGGKFELLGKGVQTSDLGLTAQRSGKLSAHAVGQHSSSEVISSSVQLTTRHSFQSPPSVPSPQNGDQFADDRSRDGDDPDDQDDVSFTITLIYDGERVLHQVWSGMTVERLTQDSAEIFDLPPPVTSIILMLFGLQPSTLGFNGRLSDPPCVTDGATILVFRVGNFALDRSPYRDAPTARYGVGLPGG
jgi:hypothetical protein